MRTLKKEIPYDCLDHLINDSNDKYKDCTLVDYYTGCLNDNYLFRNERANKGYGVIVGKKHKARKYIIIYEHYVNEWTSDAIVIETDSDKMANQFLNEVEANEIPQF